MSIAYIENYVIDDDDDEIGDAIILNSNC